MVLGVALGSYTGLLLSTIPARALWNSAALAPLFLVSGLASGSAMLALLWPRDERKRLIPTSLLLGAVEAFVLAAFALSLAYGSPETRRAAGLLSEGQLGLAFWGLVVLSGLLVPLALEALELAHRRLRVAAALPPVLTLAGGLALRVVVVYGGLASLS